MGCGRYPAFTANIFPFYDNPTFPIKVVFYSVPALNPDGPASPFPDRFWDNRENWRPLGIGTDPTSFKPYFGAVPGPAVAPLVGTAAQWGGGLSYATWLAGGYGNPNGCVPVPSVVSRARIKQASAIRTFGAKPSALTQSQQLQTTGQVGVPTVCCPGVLLPARLTMVLTGSDDGDGTYYLDRVGTSSNWQFKGAIGTCPASGSSFNVTLTCGGGGTWSVVYRTGPVQFQTDNASSASCSPFKLVFNLTHSWCGGGVNPGTLTVSP